MNTFTTFKSNITTNTKTVETTSIKYDEDKTDYALVDASFEEAVAKVLTYGKKKYGKNNWQQLPDAKDRYYAALRRHISEWRNGEKVDKETGLSHLAHAACNLMFLMFFDKKDN